MLFDMYAQFVICTMVQKAWTNELWPVTSEVLLQILRRLMELSQKDQDKLEVLHRASNTIKCLPAGIKYPARELQWLTVSGWNRGSIHCKFERLQDASAFMAAALELVTSCDILNDQRKVGSAIQAIGFMQFQAEQSAAWSPERLSWITVKLPSDSSCCCMQMMEDTLADVRTQLAKSSNMEE